jgi:predicted metalloprotease with PDZ domain
VCGCDLRPFFAQHVSGAGELDLEHSLGLLGWRAAVTRAAARDSAGRALPDRRLGASAYGGYGSAGGAAGGPLRISVGDPTSAWGRAGLTTGDQLVTVNGRRVASAAELKATLAALRVGDQASVDVLRSGAPVRARVTVIGYERTTVSLVDLPVVTPRMRRMREIWLMGR